VNTYIQWSSPSPEESPIHTDSRGKKKRNTSTIRSVSWQTSKQTDDLEAWRKDAKCRETPSLLQEFFAEDSSTVAAAHFCEDCPVVEQCLAYSLLYKIDHGVWGGTTARERIRLLRRDQASAIIGAVFGTVPNIRGG